MNRAGIWFKRHWLIIAIAVGGVLVIAWAARQGQRANQAQTGETAPPPTVAVARGEVILSVTAPGISISTDSRILSSRVDGSLDEILVQPGQAVQSGQVLFRMGERENFLTAVSAAQLQVLQYQKALDELYQDDPVQAAQIQVSLAEAQSALEKAQKDRSRLDYPRASAATIDEAEARLALADVQLANAQEAYDRVENLPASDPERAAELLALSNAQRERLNALATVNWYKGNPSQTEVALADSNLALAQAKLEEIQGDWEALKDGPDEVTLEIAQASLAQAQDALRDAQADLESLDVRAPFDGIILDIPVQAGQIIGPGTPLVTLLDPGAIQVRGTVVEEDLPLLNPGQAVDLFFDALPEANVTGTLERIVPQRDSNTQAIYPIYISLDQLPEHLASGMTVDANIIIAKQSDVLRLPRAVVHAHSDGSAEVEVWSNGQVEQRTVQVGLRGDSFVEIIDGLVEGELVVAQ